MFVAALSVACVLGAYRWWASSRPRGGIFVADCTSAWSVMLLVLLALSAFIRRIPYIDLDVPDEASLIKSNGLMVPFSFCYCALMLFRNLFGEFAHLFARFQKKRPAEAKPPENPTLEAGVP